MIFEKGLNLPFKKEISGEITPHKCNEFGIVSDDYVSLKPKFEKNPGDLIKPGDLLFYDSKNRGIRFYSFVNGEVCEITRGEKRRFISYTLKGEPSVYNYPENLSKISLKKENRDKIIDIIINSGFWISIRQRPFDRVANPDVVPDKIFVLLIDTRPYSPEIKTILNGNEEYLKTGLQIFSILTKTDLYLIKDKRITFDVELENLKIIDVSGHHPAGLVGTHINNLYPLNRKRSIWYIDYQDIIAIGKLFKDNIIDNQKVISVGGEGVKNSLYRVYNYASLDMLVSYNDDIRIIYGSPLYGRKATNKTNYTNRYINIVSSLKEANKREFMGWLKPGLNRFSVKNVFLSKLLKKEITFDTSLNGSFRPMIPVGSYEKVCLLNLPITYFLRSLLVEDIEMAEKLGVLDFGEEDMSVFTFVCVGKYDYAVYLRKILDEIEGEM